MLGTLVALALHAVPVPQTDVSRLDQTQLLELHEQIERSLPARWPGVVMMSSGAACALLCGTTAVLNALTAADPLDPDARPTFTALAIAFGVAAAVSAVAMVIGIVWYRSASNSRAEHEATLTAIDDRLDAYDRGEVPDVPPPPELPPSPIAGGSLQVAAVDALTGRPLSGVVVAAGDLRRLTDERGVVELILEPGPVQLVADKDGYREAAEFVRVIAGRRVDVTLKLVPEGQVAPSRISGLVRSAVDGKPLQATLEVDSKTVTTDPRGIFSVELQPGRHTVRMSAPTFVTQVRELELIEGARVIFNVDLQRAAP